MLARAHRLTRSQDFSVTVRGGRRAGRPTVVLHLAGRPSGDTPRVGLVVGRSVGNAVTRNQVKRRLRHVAREHLASLPGGAMLVVRALPASATASSAELRRDVAAALDRLSGRDRGGAGA